MCKKTELNNSAKKKKIIGFIYWKVTYKRNYEQL